MSQYFFFEAQMDNIPNIRFYLIVHRMLQLLRSDPQQMHRSTLPKQAAIKQASMRGIVVQMYKFKSN